MRLRVKIDGRIVGDYPEDLMKIPENMVKILKNHLHDEFTLFEMLWYNEIKTEQTQKKDHTKVLQET